MAAELSLNVNRAKFDDKKLTITTGRRPSTYAEIAQRLEGASSYRRCRLDDKMVFACRKDIADTTSLFLSLSHTQEN